MRVMTRIVAFKDKINRIWISLTYNNLVSTFRRPRVVSTTGQAMTEFLLVAPLFFFLIFAVFDFGRLFFVEMEVDNAVLEAGRFASTGNHLPDPKNPGQYLSRVNSITAMLQQAAFGQQVTNIQISSLRGGNGSAGGPGDTVTVSVTSNLKLMTPMVARGFPNGTYTFVSSASFRNEPFAAGNTK
jgi:Flp pilus assembly protein TadG